MLPLFLLMAEICMAAGMGQSLYRLVYVWIGRMRGGLAIATIGACACFSAASSSSIATAVTLGLVALFIAFPIIVTFLPSLSAG